MPPCWAMARVRGRPGSSTHRQVPLLAAPAQSRGSSRSVTPAALGPTTVATTLGGCRRYFSRYAESTASCVAASEAGTSTNVTSRSTPPARMRPVPPRFARTYHPFSGRMPNDVDVVTLAGDPDDHVLPQGSVAPVRRDPQLFGVAWASSSGVQVLMRVPSDGSILRRRGRRPPVPVRAAPSRRRARPIRGRRGSPSPWNAGFGQRGRPGRSVYPQGPVSRRRPGVPWRHGPT